jgi:RHS repeat-associated protein
MDAWNKTGSAWSNISKLPDFQERVSYDPNGNILGYKRNGNNTFAGKPLGMDSLTYSYVMGTNRLDHVSDSVPAANYDVDIDNQLAGNYSYDSIGNMTNDNAEGITNISWTVYGKISQITKNNGTTISYTYDASGNRISKVITKSSPASSDTTWYVRDAQGNVMSVYAQGIDSVNSGHLSQTEVHLYGSSRLGILRTSVDVTSAPNNNEITMPLLNKGDALTFVRGNKLFELSNHLGNVLVTINDKKLGYSSNDSTVDYFNPQVVSAQDYYPFGMLQPGREFNVSGYRYGFNGKENDNEVMGEGNQLDFGERIYDPRIGGFLSVDPLQIKYPGESHYVFVSDNPVLYADKDGRDKIITVTIIGKDGKRGVIQVTDKTYFEYKAYYVTYRLPEIPGREFVRGTKSNVYENYVIDLSNPKNSTYSKDDKAVDVFYSRFSYYYDKIFSPSDQSDKSKIGYVLMGAAPEIGDAKRNERAATGSEIMDIDKLVSVLDAYKDIYGENEGLTDFMTSEYVEKLFEYTERLMKGIDKLNEAKAIPQMKEKPKKTFVFVREDDFGNEKKGTLQNHAYTGDTTVDYKPSKDENGVDTFHIKQKETNKKNK